MLRLVTSTSGCKRSYCGFFPGIGEPVDWIQACSFRSKAAAKKNRHALLSHGEGERAGRKTSLSWRFNW